VSFNGINGARPFAGLTLGADGNFYGTTVGVGTSGDGTLFQVTTNGTLTRLVHFFSSIGQWPYGRLTLGPDGNFYGTTYSGGTSASGTVFQMTTNGTLTSLVSFNGSNGARPYAGLILGPDGNFYGTTFNGSAFQVTTNGALTSLASINSSNGSALYAGLTLGPDGNFYGAAATGGANGKGVIYRLNLPPSILAQPANVITAPGNDVAFGVTLFGTAPYSYQWLSNNIPIADGTNNFLVISNVMTSSSGNFQIVISNTWGSVTSSVASLTVLSPPQSFIGRIAGNGSLQLQLTGSPNYPYILQAATNLTSPVNWQSILTNPADGNGNWNFTVTNLPSSAGYFRAVAQ
jgi:uncharacterized repeat protein (TIGR03803 family)